MNQKSEEVQKLLKRFRLHRLWKSKVIMLSCLAVIITVAALTLPAITMEKTPQCDTQEHEHGEECYESTKTSVCEQSDPQADIETSADWEASVSGVQLKGKWNEDILAIAKSQIGYKESGQNFMLDTDGNKMGYTRYGSWYGDSYGHWCAMFVSFCINYAQVPQEQLPIEANCERWTGLLKEKGIYNEGLGTIPEPGDIIFFDYDKDKVSDQVGIVEETTEDSDGTLQSLTTIEGNKEDAVKKTEYKAEDLEAIAGFCSISSIQKKSAGEEKVQLTYEDEKLSAKMTLTGLEESLGEDAVLTVKKLEGEDEAGLYDKVLSDVSMQINDDSTTLSAFNMFDFEITENGENVQIADTAQADIKVNFSPSLFKEEEIKEDSEIQMFQIDKAATVQEDSTSDTEVSGTTKGKEEGVTSLTYSTKGVAPLVVTLSNKTVTGTYWKLIRSTSELKNNHQYAVISVQGNYALVNNYAYGYSTNYKSVVLRPVKANPDYYKISGITNSERWTYSGGNITSSGYYLNPYYNGVITTYYYAYPLYIEPADSLGCWSISSWVGGYNYFLNNANGNFYGSIYTTGFNNNSSYQYGRLSDMLIFEEVNTTLTIPDDAVVPEGSLQPGSQQKPEYDPYLAVSGEKSGSYETADGLTGNYASDPSTSQLESQFGNHPVLHGKTDFEAQKADNGKALTDKSVIYGGDDYGAYETYEDGTFGVTLSALGQVYETKTEEVKIPIDVLFVLDMSNSMNEYDEGETQCRAANLVDAINNAMGNIMDMHPNNRVCAVGYNSNAETLLTLGRYSPNRAGKYFEYSNGTVSVVTGQHKAMQCRDGTYTQLGIALGEKVLTDHNDTTFTTTIGGEEVTVPRKPVVILISDGEPTHCTNHYMDVLNTPNYGDGGAQEYNGKGILGYYTILSANYYKSLVGIHYNLPAAMYTIAFGMKEKSSEIVDQSVATSHYRATVMNPTQENIAYLSKVTSNYKDSVEIMLKNLLTGGYSEDAPVYVGAYRNLVRPGDAHFLVPVNEQNDYKNNYAYADKAYLNNTGYDGIASAFDEIINFNKIATAEFGFETQADHSITITDPVGEGMEVKSAPVLRYNGINYAPTDERINGNVTEYIYTGVVDKAPYMHKTVDLSTIKVTVTTGSDGSQSVTMSIPPASLPVYMADRSTSFFYEALPVRLIYQVGVSAKGQEMIDNTAPGESCTLYTNKYTDGQQAFAQIEPTKKNPYYKSSRTWKKTAAKTANPTQTAENAFRASGSSSKVKHELGNNGKLTFTKPMVSDHQLTVQKRWKDYSGQEKTEDLPAQITATLYRTYTTDNQETVTENVVTDFVLSKENNWTKTFLPGELNEVYGREYQYYVTENEVEGYQVSYENDGVAENTPDTPLVIINQYLYAEMVLPQTGGPGTWIFKVTGILLLGTSLLSLYVLRRKGCERRGK